MKILIVDDEPLIRASLRRVAISRGHEVAEAADGTDALVKWQQFDPDLVFLDVLMPGKTGVEVLEARQAIQGGLRPAPAKVIMISAFTGDFDWATAQTLGAHLFLAKPFPNIFSVLEEAERLVASESG